MAVCSVGRMRGAGASRSTLGAVLTIPPAGALVSIAGLALLSVALIGEFVRIDCPTVIGAETGEGWGGGVELTVTSGRCTKLIDGVFSGVERAVVGRLIIDIGFEGGLIRGCCSASITEVCGVASSG